MRVIPPLTISKSHPAVPANTSLPTTLAYHAPGLLATVPPAHNILLSIFCVFPVFFLHLTPNMGRTMVATRYHHLLPLRACRSSLLATCHRSNDNRSHNVLSATPTMTCRRRRRSDHGGGDAMVTKTTTDLRRYAPGPPLFFLFNLDFVRRRPRDPADVHRFYPHLYTATMPS
ncbi:hypothetical protein EDB84DRAFT_1509357 [Lactarius hengduanensis]|nr:hypothetical protein EDB84DRAFT_1509357 [Lactarius hengduanensis]